MIIATGRDYPFEKLPDICELTARYTMENSTGKCHILFLYEHFEGKLKVYMQKHGYFNIFPFEILAIKVAQRTTFGHDVFFFMNSLHISR